MWKWIPKTSLLEMVEAPEFLESPELVPISRFIMDHCQLDIQQTLQNQLSIHEEMTNSAILQSFAICLYFSKDLNWKMQHIMTLFDWINDENSIERVEMACQTLFLMFSELKDSLEIIDNGMIRLLDYFPQKESQIRALITAKIIVPYMIYLRHDPSQQLIWAERVWSCIKMWHQSKGWNGLRENTLRILLQFPDLGVELRSEAVFFEIMQESLSMKGLSVKFASFLLKKTLDKGHCDFQGSWSELYKYPDDPALFLESFNTFFIVHETLDEQALHLVAPCFSMIQKLLNDANTGVIHPSWVFLLLEKGYKNENEAISRTIYEMTFSLQNQESMRFLVTNIGFLYDVIIPNLDRASLFNDKDVYAVTSALGETFTQFLLFLLNQMDSNEVEKCLLKLFEISFNLSTPPALIYLLEAIASCPDETYFIKPFNMDNHFRAKGVWGKLVPQHILRQLMIKILMQSTRLTVDTAESLLHMLSTIIQDHYPVKGSKELGVIVGIFERTLKSSELCSVIATKIKKYYQNPLMKPDYSIILGILIVSCYTDFKSALNDILHPLLFMKLANIYSKPYMDTEEKLKALFLFNQLIYGFLKCDNSVNLHPLFPSLLDGVDEMLQYSEHFCFSTSKHTPLEIEIVMTTLDYIVVGECKIAYLRPAFDELYELSTIHSTNLIDGKYPEFRIIDMCLEWKDRAISLLNRCFSDNLVSTLKAMALLSKCLQRLTRHQVTDEKIVLLPDLFHHLFEIVFVRDADVQNNDEWEAMRQALNQSRVRLLTDIIRYLANVDPIALNQCQPGLFILDSFSNCDSKLYPDIFNVLSLMIQQNLLTMTQFQEAMDQVIAYLKSVWWSATQFYPVFNSWIDFICSCISNKEFTPILKKLIRQVIIWSESRTRLLTRLSHGLYMECNSRPYLLEDYKDELSLLLCYGPPRYKQERDWTQFQSMITYKLKTKAPFVEDRLQNGLDQSAAVQLAARDFVVRIHANLLLNQLTDKEENVAQAIIDHLISQYLIKGSGTTFIDNVDALKQIRIWTSLHLLLRFVTKSQSKTLIQQLFKCLEVEETTSVRCYNEWALTRLLSKFPEHLPILWEQLNDLELKAQVNMSLLIVTVQIQSSISLDSIFEPLIKSVSLWISSHHFGIRICAQYCLHQLYEKVKDAEWFNLWLHCSKLHLNLFRFLSQKTECAKHFKKLDSNVFLSLHPEEEVNLEFLWHIGLKAMSCPQPELIPWVAVEKVLQTTRTDCGFIPLRHNDIERYTRLFKETKSSVEIMSKTDQAELHIQKKIVPWQSMLFSDIDFVSIERTRTSFNPIIVVASLVSKIPNLGGLCRTCEIFNAECLVLDNLNVKNDPQFTSTSVTADKWMPLNQVRKEDLSEYLMQQKSKGYTIVGIEQATNSVSLGSFSFPKQCVLLLGAEQTGIPVHLLSMVDVVLEIPQLGIIRSLNVHVSGALVVWEYTRQRLEK